MSTRLEAVTYDAREPRRVAAFWAELLGRDVMSEGGDALLRGTPTQVGLRFVVAEPERDLDRLHLHLTSTDPDDQQRTVEDVLRLGGRHLDVGQQPDDGFVVLGDPEGNAICVIEAGNRWLAGCGRLGEVACDGSPQVGRFWRDALGWPLVWEEGEETAVQSPAGGTKLAWGGAATDPAQGRNRQRLDLVTTDLAEDTARLLALGATLLHGAPTCTELADPDGHAFRLAAG